MTRARCSVPGCFWDAVESTEAEAVDRWCVHCLYASHPGPVNGGGPSEITCTTESVE